LYAGQTDVMIAKHNRPTADLGDKRHMPLIEI